jgi:hypothetical protein
MVVTASPSASISIACNARYSARPKLVLAKRFASVWGAMPAPCAHAPRTIVRDIGQHRIGDAPQRRNGRLRQAEQFAVFTVPDDRLRLLLDRHSTAGRST